MLTIAFLAHDGVRNADMWENWLRAADTVRAVAHDESDEIKRIPGIEYVPPWRIVHTKGWGTPSVVTAAVALLAFAIKQNPDATHIALVSGRDIPLFQAEDLLSEVVEFSPATSYLQFAVDDMDALIRPHHAAMVLARDHARFIVDVWDSELEGAVAELSLAMARDGERAFPDELAFGMLLQAAKMVQEDREVVDFAKARAKDRHPNTWDGTKPKDPVKIVEVFLDDKGRERQERKEASLAQCMTAAVKERDALFFRKVEHMTWKAWKRWYDSIP